MSDPPSGHDTKGASQQTGSTPEPPHLESYAKYKEPYSKRFKRYRNRNLGRILVGVELSFAFALVVITGTYTYYAGGQLWEMRKATIETGRAADAASRSADRAKDAIEDARAALHLDQRAWLSISKIDGVAQEGSPLNVIVHIQNTGKTPAINTESVTMETVADFTVNLETLDLDARESKVKRTGVGIVSPSSDHVIVLDRPRKPIVTKPMLEALKIGNINVGSGNSEPPIPEILSRFVFSGKVSSGLR